MEDENLDSVGQKVEIGDLVIFLSGYRTKNMKFGRVVYINSGKIKVAYASIGYDVERNESEPSYIVRGPIRTYNCVVIEREYIQPELKNLLNNWNSSRKKKPLHEFLNMPKSVINQWTKERCKPL